MAYDDLSLFELPWAFVKPALEACRGFNTLLDTAFYDVPALARDLRAKGDDIETARANAPPGAIDLDAVTNPEGARLVVDAAHSPFVLRFEDMELFLQWHAAADAAPRTISVTGVGSSALGSAALAWDLSKALDEPVLAIVPGYGVADAVLQGLGGFFGFGLHDALGTKAHLQRSLAAFAPHLAKLGHSLLASTPGSDTLNDAPVFRTGSGSSDVLHALMGRIAVTRVVGHSKGALAIGNALRSLDSSRTQGLRIITLGCPIAVEAKGAMYHQFLGLFDALGQANAWGHQPTTWLSTSHTTNTALPLSMDAGALAAASAR